MLTITSMVGLGVGAVELIANAVVSQKVKKGIDCRMQEQFGMSLDEYNKLGDKEIKSIMAQLPKREGA